MPEPPSAYGLTGRELAVLRLLAAGCTNAQIGAELYVSHKTTSVHVSNILRKLGVCGRTQAAALAARVGLLTAAGLWPGPREATSTGHLELEQRRRRAAGMQSL